MGPYPYITNTTTQRQSRDTVIAVIDNINSYTPKVIIGFRNGPSVTEFVKDGLSGAVGHAQIGIRVGAETHWFGFSPDGEYAEDSYALMAGCPGQFEIESRDDLNVIKELSLTTQQTKDVLSSMLAQIDVGSQKYSFMALTDGLDCITMLDKILGNVGISASRTALDNGVVGPIRLDALLNEMHKNSIEYQVNKDVERCFLSGTQILLNDGSTKKIEKINVGDIVAAYRPDELLHSGILREGRVTQVLRNLTHWVVDLRGLYCTPGHVFLSSAEDDESKVEFLPISQILKNDKLIIKSNGEKVRARTGAAYKSENDCPVMVYFPRNSCRYLAEFAYVRAGIPVSTCLESENCHESRISLASWLSAKGISVTSDGEFLDRNGFRFSAVTWPCSASPLDSIETQNWVIETSEIKKYVPQWISNLPNSDDRRSLRLA